MDQDRISNLPKIILHNILSRLPEEDAARTSVLSKAWAETWSTFPILSFCDTTFIGTSPQPDEDFFRKRNNFLDYVKKTLLRFHDQGLAIKQFNLSANCFDFPDMSWNVDLWLKLAGECRVRVLELFLFDRAEQGCDWESQKRCYVFTTGVLEAKSLYKLELMGGIRIDQAFMNLSIKCFSLRVLSLWRVLVEDENAIEYLISRCPLLKYVTLKCCSVLNPGGTGGTCHMKSLNIQGLPNLKEVNIQGIQEVYIDAPSLEKLTYCPDDLNASFKLDFDGCTNLRQLHLRNFQIIVITEKWFIELFRKFPLLESLNLDNCTMSERIYISSDKLKVLMLSDCSNLKEVIIDAPNLSSCRYCNRGAPRPMVSFLRSSCQLEVNVRIFLDHLDFYNLREFIQNFKPRNILASLSLFTYPPVVNVLDPVVLQDSSSPPRIKHLDLRYHYVTENEMFFWPVVNGLLSSCCPETISFRSNSFSCRAFIEFFYETLMGRKENDCFCITGHAKCWWHGLKGVKVTSAGKTVENADFKTMLDALPTHAANDNIIFRLEL